MNSPQPPSERELLRFVRNEARLLDEARFEEWLGLFDADGHYWLPLSPDQTDARLQQSILFEDTVLLKVRVQRFAHPRAHSHQPPVRCQHMLQESEIEKADHAANAYLTRTPFVYVELRGGEQTIFTGVARHTLRFTGGEFRIVQKRVDLLNAQAELPAIFLIP